jgi:hypothetical protein
MEESKHAGLLSYVKSTTSGMLDTVRNTKIVSKGENLVLPAYNSVMGGYVSPFV